MPYVNIRITRDGVTAEQKQQLIAGTTELLVRVLNKNPDHTFVLIDEVDTDNWGVGYETTTAYRARAAAAKAAG
ncbi:MULTISPECIES: tautomerase family protein [unclassified Janthinobacterium]|uniref:tautomerase family protein n=1 Tax=unclassified Janthinobacterium TaxID=2610881 RepID=UPI000347F617|nr:MULTISPECIES: 4-oxalocrotonate tautomerase family protein [unclassified Janthinobacterium]MEC5162662.1 4-oxalocrotonate tautomerase [Janthinobacterium sp. CG_S6]